MEVLLATAVFIGAGMAVLGAVERAVASAEYVRDMHAAADLARSTMSRIEAGLDDPVAVSGPARRWSEDEGAFDENAAASEWELRVETTPSPFDGLTLVSVTAVREDDGGGRAVSCTLRQLVRLSRDAATEGGRP